MQFVMTTVKEFNFKGMMTFDEKQERWLNSNNMVEPNICDYVFADEDGNIREEGYVGIGKGFCVDGETRSDLIKRVLEFAEDMKSKMH